MKALTNNELLTIVARDRQLDRRFAGVFAANELTTIANGELAIINCCSRHLPGIHWLAICQLPKKELEFFDSFGKYPLVYRDLMLPEEQKIVFNNRQLQSLTSEVCGYYTLYYCYYRARNWTLKEIVNSFSYFDYIGNDYFVYDSVCKLFNLNNY